VKDVYDVVERKYKELEEQQHLQIHDTEKTDRASPPFSLGQDYDSTDPMTYSSGIPRRRGGSDERKMSLSAMTMLSPRFSRKVND
jgi:hypothetical protein